MYFPHPTVILTISLQNTKIRIRENIIFLSLDIIVLFFVKNLNTYGTRSSVDIDEQRIKFDDGSYTGDIMSHVSCCILCNNSNDHTRCCLAIKHFLGFPFHGVYDESPCNKIFGRNEHSRAELVIQNLIKGHLQRVYKNDLLSKSQGIKIFTNNEI